MKKILVIFAAAIMMAGATSCTCCSSKCSDKCECEKTECCSEETTKCCEKTDSTKCCGECEHADSTKCCSEKACEGCEKAGECCKAE